MSLDSVFGSHSAFYYYSKEHLFINLLHYVKKGLDNNELIYILMKENKFKELSSFFTNQNISTDNIYFFTEEAFSNLTNKLDINNIQNGMLKILNSANIKGFSGIRLIEDCSHIITLTSKEFFLELERKLTNLVKNSNMSLLCTYDVYEYIQASSDNYIVNKEIIDNSIHSHSHFLRKFELHGA
ncbi:MEDS domain-containing protein [Haloimpatiens lingqiaonensis]|uniref:MEDS domain-containing protein n=1 Tax=Haloimpatiens lingqiaonensis TaxID=1380675 RepID=UPI0010FE48DE|nr:MEDS domain-containing protein [Haloimpatiens lingqiaonensis]